MNQNESFSEFSHTYADSAQFPTQAIEQIPSELLNAIDRGNALFFSDLKEDWPKFYSVLTNSCGDIRLLENISFGMGLNNFGKEYRTYWWGFRCKGKLITAKIPVSNPGNTQSERYKADYLPCLPRQLHCFYNKMDGIAIAESIGPFGFDLPSSFGDWRRLKNYCEDKAVNLPKSLVNDFKGDDLRVFIQCSNGDIVVTNFTKKDGNLYLLKRNSFEFYQVLVNPVASLDIYFSQAVLGTPSPIA